MNERIKELIKQAGGHFSTHTLTSYPAQHRESIELWDKNIEKFAELIVRECIREIGYKSVELLDIDFYPHYQERLKKHFGVEE